jgi:hypothetical protein
MKSVLGIVTLALLNAPSAQAFTCRAEMLKSMCGSGVVEITVDEPSYAFALTNGDVHCWNMDAEAKGRAIDKGSVYPFFDAKTFKLTVLNETTGLQEDYGTIAYDAKRAKARLSIVDPNLPGLGVMSEKYDLECKEGL